MEETMSKKPCWIWRTAMAFAVAQPILQILLLLLAALPAAAQERGPLVLAKSSYFFVGGKIDTSLEGSPMVGQMYVEYLIPQRQRHPYPVVMVHGGGQTGTNFTGTPDRREGWAQRFVAPEQDPKWPQARLHTQFPGAGKPGDGDFDQFYASQFPSIASFPRQQELNRDALVALLDKIGPAILLTHSQSGAFGWPVADARPKLVKAILAIEPSGPPAHDIENLGPPDWFKDAERTKLSGLGDIPITYDPPLGEGEKLAFVRAEAPEKPDLVRCWRQQEPARKLVNLTRTPVLVVTSEASYHAAYDDCTAAYLAQAGVPVRQMHLADLGIHGNGHMMMIEKNNAAIARSWWIGSIRDP